MITLYSNSVEIQEGFTAHDIEYLRRQILTTRSVLTDQQKTTNLVSHLFESAKTMLSACEFLGAVDMERAILEWKRIRVEVMVPSENESPDLATPKATLYAKGRIACVDDFVKDYMWIELLSSYTTRPNREFFATFYITIPCSDEPIKIGTDVRAANPNMVLAYQENFPAPTVFVNDIRDRIIIPAVNSIMQRGRVVAEREIRMGDNEQKGE